jgi:hypothetical protein
VNPICAGSISIDCRYDNFNIAKRGDGPMRVRSMVLVVAFMFAGAGSSAVVAQTMGLDECRAQAISKGLVGDARNTAINDCMGRPAVQGVATASGSRFATCRGDARGRGLSGDAFNAALDQCMTQSGAAAESGGKATYQDCRGRAISRGLSGEALGEFIDSCLND